jgi:small neutral amino acid transporter SnatA (MarC family)
VSTVTFLSTFPTLLAIINPLAALPVLAMPLMFGPGTIATVLGMTSLVRHPFAEFPSLAAIVAAIGVGLIFHGVMDAIQTYLPVRAP